MPKPSNYAIVRDQRFARTIRQPEALPFGSGVIDANNEALIRQEEGWRYTNLEKQTFYGEPVGTLDLAYPVKVLATR